MPQEGGEEVNEYEDNYDLTEMSDEEKDELILKLSTDLNTTFIIAAGDRLAQGG